MCLQTIMCKPAHKVPVEDYWKPKDESLLKELETIHIPASKRKYISIDVKEANKKLSWWGHHLWATVPKFRIPSSGISEPKAIFTLVYSTNLQRPLQLKALVKKREKHQNSLIRTTWKWFIHIWNSARSWCMNVTKSYVEISEGWPEFAHSKLSFTAETSLLRNMSRTIRREQTTWCQNLEEKTGSEEIEVFLRPPFRIFSTCMEFCILHRTVSLICII